ncbi:MAG: MbnP family protein [Verrucomicrobiota bacterium]
MELTTKEFVSCETTAGRSVKLCVTSARCKILQRCALVLLLVATNLFRSEAAPLKMAIDPRWFDKSLAFDAITNVTKADQSISVTRLDFLLSNIALRRADGNWFTSTNFAFISAREGHTSFEINDVPSANYDRVKFCVGLSSEINHGAPAQYSAAHPLNPNINGLHWNWKGGYVFLALEGNWLTSDGKQSGYSYHIATDEQLVTVELPVILNSSSNQKLNLALNVDQIFSASTHIKIDDETATTHSRTNDALVGQLRKNIENAFTAQNAQEVVALATTTPASTNKIEIAPGATPFRFTMSAAFPQPALPMDNPLTEEGVELGRRLFSDSQLSINNAQACASCHDSSKGFAENKRVSIGVEGIAGTRNAMPFFNLAWKSSFFWDGRAASLREQVLQPIQNPIEMHESLTNVVAKLSKKKEYPNLFAQAFGTREITADRIARAMEQFLLTQVSHDSKFDRVLNGAAKFSEEEQRGFELFHTEYDPRREQFGADCFHCHGGPLFQSQSFANNGLDLKFSDLGRFDATKKEGDKGKFAVPSLRNVEVTAPYMHDGRVKSLEEVVEHYSSGIKRSQTLDPNLAKHPDGGVPLSDSDKKALVAFLKTLTDEKYYQQTNRVSQIAANPLTR